MIRMSAALLAVCLISASVARAQDVAAETTRNILQATSTTELRDTAKSEFKAFRRKADFFGAIYINLTEDIAGAFWSANLLAVAEENARAACRVKSENPDGCVLYARVVPKNFDPMSDKIPLSRISTKEFREYSRLQNTDRFGAFAVNDNGAVGFSWAEASPGWAEDEALKRCAKSARKLLRKTPDILEPVVSLPNKQGCRLVHQTP